MSLTGVQWGWAFEFQENVKHISNRMATGEHRKGVD